MQLCAYYVIYSLNDLIVSVTGSVLERVSAKLPSLGFRKFLFAIFVFRAFCLHVTQTKTEKVQDNTNAITNFT